MGTFEIKQTDSGLLYFQLKSNNGSIIATSNFYRTKTGCENAILSVKKNTPFQKILEGIEEVNQMMKDSYEM